MPLLHASCVCVLVGFRHSGSCIGLASEELLMEMSINDSLRTAVRTGEWIEMFVALGAKVSWAAYSSLNALGRAAATELCNINGSGVSMGLPFLDLG